MVKTVAGYARFSPDDATKITIEMQEEGMRRVCQAKGWTYWKTFPDKDLSGGLPVEMRSGLQELVDNLGSGSFDTVMAYEVGRLARDSLIFWTLIDVFKAKGTVFVTAMIPDIDSSMPTFTATIGTLQNFATYFRLETKQKTRDALATLAKAGYAVSRPPLGYELVETEGGHKKLILDELGERVKKELEVNPKLKPKALMEILGVGYKTAWHLINNVRDD
jgi:DNA invertase Pin-like site-specific DNA recombinase